MKQIEDPRWRSYARAQQTLMGRSRLNDVTTGCEGELDALIGRHPRDGESYDEMGSRVRASAIRRERRRRLLTIAADDLVRDGARARSTGAPEAAMHARIMLASIVLQASPGERRLVFDLATGASLSGPPAATFRKRLQRFRLRLCA